MNLPFTSHTATLGQLHEWKTDSLWVFRKFDFSQFLNHRIITRQFFGYLVQILFTIFSLFYRKIINGRSLLCLLTDPSDKAVMHTLYTCVCVWPMYIYTVYMYSSLSAHGEDLNGMWKICPRHVAEIDTHTHTHTHTHIHTGAIQIRPWLRLCTQGDRERERQRTRERRGGSGGGGVRRLKC